MRNSHDGCAGPDEGETVAIGKREVEQQDVRASPGHEIEGVLLGGRFADDLEAASPARTSRRPSRTRWWSSTRATRMGRRAFWRSGSAGIASAFDIPGGHHPTEPPPGEGSAISPPGPLGIGATVVARIEVARERYVQLDRRPSARP